MKSIINFFLVLSFFAVLTGCSDSAWDNSPIDDKESSQTAVDISSPKDWSLASVPADPTLFPEASLSNDVAYGKNRALLAWYNVDRLFTQRNSSYAPGYIKNDGEALSYPYVREVSIQEIYPYRELNYGESSVIQTLNLSFFPRERGPYNLDCTDVEQDGYLRYPERRWGGIMRKMDDTNFEQADIKYIRFWLLDPFMDTELGNLDGGYLYFNLGDVSEDILKDGLMSYENGLPVDDGTTYITPSVWGRVSNKTPVNYAFDDGGSTRLLQDVGLDGLINNDEFTHSTYTNYLSELRYVLSESTFADMMNNPFSPFNDPACDNYLYYLSNYYDSMHASIIERYKHYNGTDGNSLPIRYANDAQYQMGRTTPDTEDINDDNTLNEDERFFQYCVAIHPDSLTVGKNYITDMHIINVHTRNGKTQETTWYQFTIPLQEYQKKNGSIQDFSNIRFMRIYMTGFKGTTHLRFATLELVRGE